MKLMLDEMHPHSIAEQLRTRGHDVLAVGERSELRGAADRTLFAVAQDEQRALVTDDVGFRAIDAEHRSRGETHWGLILTTNRRFPRGRPATMGRLVRSLDRFLSEDAPALDDHSSLIWWLQ